MLMVLVSATVTVALVFGAGPAFAGGTVNCAPYGVQTAADVQTAANSGGTVTINGVCSGTVNLTANVTLQGGTPGATSGLNGTGFDGPVISQTSGADLVTLTNLLVTGGGHNSGDGGGVWNDNRDCAAVTNVVSSRVIGNTISINESNAWGAGINAESCTTMNVTNSLVAGNATPAPDGNGAGIASDCASAVNLSGSTVSGNTAAGVGGGIYIRSCGSSTLSVVASTINNNTSAVDGGGIFSLRADVLVQNSTLSANSAVGYGGGIEFGGNQSGGQDGGARPSAGVAAHGPQAPVLQGHSQSVHAQPQAPLLPPLVPAGLTVIGSSVNTNWAKNGAGGGIDVFTNCDGLVPVAITNSSVSFNRATGSDFDTDSGGGGYSQYSECGGDTASLVAGGSSFIGNKAVTSVGGGIFNVSYGGSALVTLANTSVAAGPFYVNPNRAKYGAGIFNWDTNSNVTLQPFSYIIRNQASVNGGGVYNDCGATLTVVPGAILMFNSPNQVFSNLGPCVVND